MKNLNRFLPLFILFISICFFGFKEGAAQSANSLTFGGVKVTIDMMDCSTENSSDGKSRAIAATNLATISSIVIQFGSLDPSSGTYTTISEDPIGAGQVVVGGAGKAFGGGFVADAGQTITITNTGGKYKASFKDLALSDPSTKKPLAKKMTGNFGCE